MLLDEIEMDNKLNGKNIQAKLECGQRANKWKGVIKQAAHVLEAAAEFLLATQSAFSLRVVNSLPRGWYLHTFNFIS
jgi:hypothetical protein